MPKSPMRTFSITHPLAHLSALALIIASLALSQASAFVGQKTSVPPQQAPKLPLHTVFQGEATFYKIIAKAEREGWRHLPIGQRTTYIAKELLGKPYKNYTLEVHNHIESPVVNLNQMDCWTFYENALAIARLIQFKPGPYTPQDMLHMIEVERYRNGICRGNYLDRMHHLEEVFANNQQRGYATNITPHLPGATRIRRSIQEMTVEWKNYRYLKSNPSLIKPMAKIEAQVSRLPVYHIPKAQVPAIESYLQNGDICAITTHSPNAYTSHVGLIFKQNGRAYFAHATSNTAKGRATVLDCPISHYLNEASKHAGIIICRPHDLPR